MNTEPPAERSSFDWHRVAALTALTAIGIYLCYLIAVPFLPGVAWAVAAAVVGLPLHRRILRATDSPNWAAGLSTAIVVLVIAVPVVLVGMQLGVETTKAAERVEAETYSGRWREYAARVPYYGDRLSRIDVNEVEGQLRTAVAQLGMRTLGVIGTVMEGVLQALVSVFVLFFCFRDRHHLLNAVRQLLPLPTDAANKVIDRAADAVHATVYGTLLTAVIQSVTGGLLFWWLGLPVPVLWGFVIFVLSVLPFLGAFLVWIPACFYLATLDRWGAIAALVAWGLFMAGPMSNYVYAYAAGDRMKMHPVPTLIAFIGGLAVFGISGMVLGPCVLVVTVALIDVWRHRTPDAAVIVPGKDRPTTVVLEDRVGRPAPALGPTEPAAARE
jgi:predicted PurR-regulated permease PerM